MKELSEEIATEWLKSKDFFCKNNILLGYNKEIDILAVKMDTKRKNIIDAIHVEVQVSPRPSGFDSDKRIKTPEESVKRYVKRKYEDKMIITEVKKRLGKKYRKMLIKGHIGANEKIINRYIKELQSHSIEVVWFKDVLEELMSKDRCVNKTIQFMKYFDVK